MSVSFPPSEVSPSLLVRTWNVFHGRTVPDRPGSALARMVRLIAGGAPDVVCLQEVPVWAIGAVERWSGMRSFAAVTRAGLPFGLGGTLGRRVTARRPALLRSGLTGQANVLLVAAGHEPLGAVDLLRLEGPGSHWPKREPRIALSVGLRVGRRELVVANAHLSTAVGEAERELDHLERWLRRGAGGAPIVLAGDLNLSPASTTAFATLAAAGWTAPASGIDHVLAHGLTAVQGPAAWPQAARRHGEVLLSDHAPVEAVMMWP